MHFPEIFYWIATTRLEGIGYLRMRRWLNQVKNIQHFFSATTTELLSLGLSDKNIFALKNIDWKIVERDFLWCEKNHCHAISIEDSRYPRLLQEISDAPLLLYVQGDVELLSQSQIAIVGSRNPTTTAIETAKHFAQCLTKAGLIITSGMALGIDAAGHRGALSANGKTIAITGSGLQHIYPRSHSRLAEKIISQGALVSEFALDTQPKAQHFPMRNRVISGMSLGVLVVEAALNSGSLITARFAMEQNREVFAIPGSIHNPLAKGCHQLIGEGAKLVQTVDDILEELGSLHVLIHEKPMSNPQHIGLLNHIGFEATPFDTILSRSKMKAEELYSLLLSLELEGYITSMTGGYMRIKSI